MNNNDIISQLKSVQELLSDLNYQEFVLSYDSDYEFYQKCEQLHEDLGELPVPKAFSKMPTMPLSESYYAATLQHKQKTTKLMAICGGASALLFIIFKISKWDFLATVTGAAILATIGAAYLFNKCRKEFNAKKQEYDKSVSTFNETYKEFSVALKNFDAEKQTFIDSAQEYADKYAHAYDMAIEAFCEKTDREKAANERIAEIKKELAGYSAIPSEYYHLVNSVVSNLESGRADSYKEALNLAIREEKEEQERNHRLEQEEERNRILRQQAEEERRHNEQMERQQKLHDEAMQHEQKRQTDAILREQRRQQDAGIAKCATCANRGKCSPSAMRGGGFSCGGYRPAR